MTATSTETGTDDGFAVITLVTRLHAAAKAGRALLEAIDTDAPYDVVYPSEHMSKAIVAARAAYDRLAELDHPAAP